MRLQMKARKRKNQSCKWQRRRRSSHHKGDGRLKQFREPWMKRMRELERLRPGRARAGRRRRRKRIGLNGPEVIVIYFTKMFFNACNWFCLCHKIAISFTLQHLNKTRVEAPSVGSSLILWRRNSVKSAKKLPQNRSKLMLNGSLVCGWKCLKNQ